MKDLIVYYSLEGNTELIAERISRQMGADLLSLNPKKAYPNKGITKFLWGGKSALMAEKPELEEYSVDLSAYDRIVFGFPVWASTFAPPLRTFIEDHKEELKDKAFASFACQGGSGAEKAFSKLANALGIDVVEQTAIFNEPKSKPEEEVIARVNDFCAKLTKK